MAQNHVRLDAVRTAIASVRRDSVEIVNLCAAAGLPQLASDFIGKATSVDAVRAELARFLSGPAAPARQQEVSAFGPRAQPITFGFDAASIPSRFDLKPSGGVRVTTESQLPTQPQPFSDRAYFEAIR
jgi:hypothetical protein